MPVERRSLRSNKESSSTNNSSKDKSAHSRTTSKSKAAPAKKSSSEQAAKSNAGTKPVTNGNELVQNGINGSSDIDMNGESSMGDKMTVVVPPSKGSKTLEQSGKDDDAMVIEEEGTSKADADKEATVKARERLPLGLSRIGTDV